jgi:hypothetical protein
MVACQSTSVFPYRETVVDFLNTVPLSHLTSGPLRISNNRLKFTLFSGSQRKGNRLPLSKRKESDESTVEVKSNFLFIVYINQEKGSRLLWAKAWLGVLSGTRKYG